MERYEIYKDSKNQFLGLIPSNWEKVKFNHYVFLRHGHQFRDFDFTPSGIKIIKISQLLANGEMDTTNVSYIEENRLDDFKDILIKEGDILMALTGGTIGKIIKAKEVKEALLQNYRVGNFFPLNDELSKSFLFWVLSSQNILDQIFYDQKETGQPNIGKEDFGRMAIALPKTIEEQTAIANYLDRKIAEIDELIADKKSLLELYEEEKTAIINQAVTKGINPDVPMKNSGIEWLGEIPEHWTNSPLKYLGKFINGYSFKSTDFESSGIRVLKISNIQNMHIDWSDSSYIDEKFYDIHKGFRVFKNDLVFALTRPIISTGIKVALIDTDEKILLNQRNSVYRPSRIQIKWFYYLLLSKNFIQEFDSRIDKTGQQPNISSNDIGDISIPVPPESEQEKLILFIDKHSTEIDFKINKTKRLIDLLTEYRTALISEVVTGKIKVTEE